MRGGLILYILRLPTIVGGTPYKLASLLLTINKRGCIMGNKKRLTYRQRLQRRRNRLGVAVIIGGAVIAGLLLWLQYLLLTTGVNNPVILI